MDLQDRIVLLTAGAGPNMGGAIASAFAKAGATLIVVDLDGEAAEASAATLREAGGKATSGQLDVSDRKACIETVEKVVRDHGRIDVLYNHAGYMGSMAAAANTDDNAWDMNIAVNLSGPFFLSRAALPHMLERGRGAITNTISEAGLRAGASGAAYTASKHGLVGLTKSIAWAYAKGGIRCNGVCPGGTMNMELGDPETIDMPFPKDGDPYGMDRIVPVIRRQPRFNKPHEIANLAVFLSSDAASGVNGQIVAADSGWSVG